MLNTAGTTGGEVKKIKQLQIPQAIGELSFAVERLETMIGDFGDRLNKIMRNEPPADTTKKVAEMYTAPLAEEIGIQTARIYVQISMLDSFLARLEI